MDRTMNDKELKTLLDKAHSNLKGKFAPKETLFLDRVNRKVMRFKHLNEVEINKLKEIGK